jgi:L-ascorbate metabolism protein UlaG (beta-lactamase superfamily)
MPHGGKGAHVAVKLQFYGTAGYRIVTESGKTVLIDPYLDKNPVCPIKSDDIEAADLILVTHLAYDHFGDTPALANRLRPLVVGAKDVVHALTTVHGVDPDLMRVTIWGLQMEVAGVRIIPVPSQHWSFGVTPSGELLSGPAVGYMIDAGPGVRIYHPGDSAITQDMRLWGQLYRPTVGLMVMALPEASLPHMECYLSGETTPAEALLASEWLGLDHVITSHYQRPDHPDVQSFLRLAQATADANGYAPRITVLSAGDEVEL